MKSPPAIRCSARFTKWLRRLVGAGRFELPTPCSRSKCATRLRYAPPDHDRASWALPMRQSLDALPYSRGSAGLQAKVLPAAVFWVSATWSRRPASAALRLAGQPGG